MPPPSSKIQLDFPRCERHWGGVRGKPKPEGAGEGRRNLAAREPISRAVSQFLCCPISAKILLFPSLHRFAGANATRAEEFDVDYAARVRLRIHGSLLVCLALPFFSACGKKQREASKQKETLQGAPEIPSSAPDSSGDSKTSPEAADARAPRKVSAEDILAQIRASGARATLVNVWASWCGPCRSEFPMLVGLTDNLKQNQVDVLFVSVDEDESLAAAEEFARTNGKEPPLLVAQRPLGLFKSGLNPRWKGALPATFLFDGAGKLRYFWGGPVYDHELLPIVDGLLRGEKIDGEANFGLSPGKDMRQR